MTRSTENKDLVIRDVCRYKYHIFENLRSTTFGCEDFANRESEFVAKTQLLSKLFYK